MGAGVEIVGLRAVTFLSRGAVAPKYLLEEVKPNAVKVLQRSGHAAQLVDLDSSWSTHSQL